MNLSKPAILGGPRAVAADQNQASRWPILTDEDEQAVLDVMRHGDLSLHPVTKQLEDDYRQLTGRRHALAHCNGTAAMLAAFFALDLQRGDEILAPSATHWASVAPMLWLGAVPVFCESEMDRSGIDPEDAERRITARTRAIVVTHLWGMPCRMTELLDLARRHGLRIIEDASHAHGAIWRGRPCGALGDLSVMSLQTSKLAPAGEGGILMTDDDAMYERAICLGDIERIIELQTPAQRFAGTSFGIKTRLSPLSAAIGRVQLRHLETRNAERNERLRYISEALERLGFGTFLSPPHIRRTYFEYLIRYDPDRWGLSAERLIEALQAEGCAAAWPRYPLLHQQPLFTEGHAMRIAGLEGRAGMDVPVYDPHALPKIEAGNRLMIRLPAFPRASLVLLDQYIQAFEKVMAHAREIAEGGMK